MQSFLVEIILKENLLVNASKKVLNWLLLAWPAGRYSNTCNKWSSNVLVLKAKVNTKMVTTRQILFLLLLSFHQGYTAILDEANEEGGVVLKMEHSVDGGKSYSNRGSVTIHSLRSGAVSIQQDDLTEVRRNWQNQY